MPLTSVLVPYDEQWPRLFSETADWLIPVFGSELIALHHIGSTAVPGLWAKPEIDVLACVTDVRQAGRWEPPLAARGFMRGGDLSEGHLFFKRNANGVRTHKLHVCVDGHRTADRMLRFRDHLRRSRAHRDEYASLKRRLEAENTQGIGEYLARKGPFIEAIVDGTADAPVGGGKSGSNSRQGAGDP
jgi:GrpB-like predicted nucleotidyltransferase (UPF0157 family)